MPDAHLDHPTTERSRYVRSRAVLVRVFKKAHSRRASANAWIDISSDCLSRLAAVTPPELTSEDFSECGRQASSMK